MIDTVFWVKVARPTFDMVGLVLGSLTLVGVLVATTLILGLLTGVSLILLRRNPPPPAPSLLSATTGTRIAQRAIST